MVIGVGARPRDGEHGARAVVPCPGPGFVRKRLVPSRFPQEGDVDWLVEVLGGDVGDVLKQAAAVCDKLSLGKREGYVLVASAGGDGIFRLGKRDGARGAGPGKWKREDQGHPR